MQSPNSDSRPPLSIIVPLYNEASTVEAILKQLCALPGRNEIIVVDDASTDDSRKRAAAFGNRILLLRHERNRGKGAAIRTGLAKATGQFVVIQDADLEYDPNDLLRMLSAIEASQGPVLFGARVRSVVWQSSLRELRFRAGTRLLTLLANILFNQRLTDEATCYKMFERTFMLSLPLRADRFEFCPEVIALCSERGIQIPEIPISYKARTKKEGKKIGLTDWFTAVYTLLHYRRTMDTKKSVALAKRTL